jgi:hypothetical protein
MDNDPNFIAHLILTAFFGGGGFFLLMKMATRSRRQ